MVTTLGLAVTTIPAMGRQDRVKLSPAAKAECHLPGGKTITIAYSSPRMKGRKIYGDLVPWGKIWRAGADEATTFVTDADLRVGGKTVPAGHYTIFTVPNADRWELIVNKKIGEWGTVNPTPSDELVRADMKVSSLPAPLENFTIAFDKTGSGCTLRMDWETTRASVGISAK
jgi:hypothetical protein